MSRARALFTSAAFAGFRRADWVELGLLALDQGDVSARKAWGDIVDEAGACPACWRTDCGCPVCGQDCSHDCEHTRVREEEGT